jgi:hypothetical protein
MTEIEWSIAGYSDVLQSLHALRFSSITDPAQESVVEKKIVLRHDIDFDLNAALKIAEIDSAIGFSSMFFLMPDSEFYSISSQSSKHAIEEICSQGHTIGIHWDYRNYSLDSDKASSRFNLHLAMLEELTQSAVKYSSQHMPTSSLNSVNLNPEGVVDMYSAKVMGNYRYISDSSMSWRGENILQLAHHAKNIVFLAHPIWWVIDGLTSFEKLSALKDQKINELASHFEIFESEMLRVLELRTEIDSKFRETRGLE